MKVLYLDFEFTDISERDLKLVCLCSSLYVDAKEVEKKSFWLYDGSESVAASDYLLSHSDAIFVAYVMEAEARSIFTLFGRENIKFKAIDLYLEYRLLTNHNHDYAYGSQLIDGKVIVTTPPPLYAEVDDSEEDSNHHKPQHSLAACTYKLLGKIIDTAEKEEVRNIIISDTDIENNRQRIVDYCMSDVANLREIFKRVSSVISREGGFTGAEYLDFALSRGAYAVCAAKMTRRGYPVNLERVKKFASNVPEIMSEAAKSVIAASDEFKLFRLNLKTKTYSMNVVEVRKFIASTPYSEVWTKTDKGQLSTSRKAFDRFYSKNSPGLAGEFIKYLSLKQSLNGFLPSEGKSKKFWDFVGRDARVRYFQGIYGSQSSRSQPGANGFIPLKAHWMRNFIEPRPGRAIAGIDYASQEFLLAAVISQDKKMLQAYESGDIYLAFAKAAGLAPSDATKTTHKAVRDMCKSLVLGISYDMGKVGLALKLTTDSGVTYTPDQAQKFIDKFYETYPDYAQWKEDTIMDYREFEQLTLPDGWVMWGDNPNFRSVGNFPIQGLGAVIMRDAVKLAFDRRLDVIYTLHDALYIECSSREPYEIQILMECMQEAYRNRAKTYGEFVDIRLEGEAWSRDYSNGVKYSIPGVEFMPEYIDDRGRADYERFKKYFKKY